MECIHTVVSALQIDDDDDDDDDADGSQTRDWTLTYWSVSHERHGIMTFCNKAESNH